MNSVPPAADSGLAVPPEAAAVFGAQLPLATRYAEFLVGPGIERGLLGPREAARIWDRHLLNCAALTEPLPAGARVVDVGSGAGLPGVAMAIRRSDLRVDLIESLRRRTDFLAEALDVLGLTDRVRIIHGRAEDPDVVASAGQADWVTARAVAPMDRLVTWCLPLLRPGGHLLAVKGDRSRRELAEHAAAIRRAGGANARAVRCTVPTDGNRPEPSAMVNLVVVRRGRRSSGNGRGM
jgi:16S rRNA (guanine527-N7)-methyltransferase